MTRTTTNFSEYSLGSPPADWTEYWGTASFSLNIVSGGASGQELHFDLSAADKRCSAGWNAIGSLLNGEILARVKWASAAVYNIGVGCRLSGTAGAENGYAIYCNDSSNQIRLRRYVSGVGSTDLATAAVTLDYSYYHWIRFRFIADNLKVRAWKDGGAEPGTWGIDYTDPTPYNSNGAVGLANYSLDGWCDYFQYWNLEDDPVVAVNPVNTNVLIQPIRGRIL